MNATGGEKKKIYIQLKHQNGNTLSGQQSRQLNNALVHSK